MEYTDDGCGGVSCPECGYALGSGHATWCDNPERRDVATDNG